MPKNRLSQRKLSNRGLNPITQYTYAGVIDTIGPRSRGSYIDGKSNADFATCNYSYVSDCGCCGNDGPPYYNCSECQAYYAEVAVAVPSSSFSNTPARGYMDSNKGFKSFAIASYYSSTYYTAVDCSSCNGGYGSTVAWMDAYGASYNYLGDMAYAGIKEADGTLWTWGYNEYGLLGRNTSGLSTSTKSPVQLGSNSWKMVVGSSSGNQQGFFAAIRSDDTLWTWGYNGYGQLGDGTTTNRSSPVQVSGGGSWKYISVSEFHMCGIKTDGTAHCWGYDAYGQLGDNSTSAKYSPVQVYGGGTWKKVVAGYLSTTGIKTDGTAYSWGYNAFYVLGVGNNVNRSSPTQIVGGYTDWIDVGIPYGQYRGYGIRSDNTLWAWGWYPLGITAGTYSTPQQVGSSANWASCSIDNGTHDYWAYSTNGVFFIKTNGNVTYLGGYTSSETNAYTGGGASQIIRPAGNYYANAFLMKYIL